MRMVEIRCWDPAADTGYLVISVNPARIVWISDHPEKPGRGLLRLTDDQVFITEGNRAHVTALVEGKTRGTR